MAENNNNPVAKTDKPAKVKKPSIFARIVKWARDLKSEAKKVVWPSRSQVTNNTIIVLATVFVVGAFIAVIDWAFGLGIKALISINLG